MEGSEASIPRVLPRGRNALDREIVASSQRTRLLEAIVKLTAENGYHATTISAIVAEAGVAKPTFYEHFQSKDACLGTYLDEGIQRITAAIGAALDPTAEIPVRVRQGISALLTEVENDPLGARVLLIESLVAGEFGRRRVDGMLAMFTAFYISLREEVREARPEIPPLSRVRAQAIVGALYEPIASAVREDRAADLPKMLDELIDVVTVLATVEN